MEGAFYKRLNELLRARERAGLQPFYPFLRLMLEARDKLPRYAGVVWRGAASTCAATSLRKEFYWWAFSSTSKELDAPVAAVHGDVRRPHDLQHPGARRRRRLEVQPLRRRRGGGAALPGTKLVVIDNMMGGGLFMVHLKEIEVPVTLID